MTTDFIHTASLAAREPDQLRDPIVAEKLTKAASHARPIISGAAGRQVLQDYSELLQDFDHAGWSRISLMLFRAEKFLGALLLLCAMGAAWRRCVHYYEQPQFQVLVACDPVVDAASVRELVDGLRRSMIACSKCVVRSFL